MPEPDEAVPFVAFMPRRGTGPKWIEDRTAVELFELRVMPMLTKIALKMREMREVIWEERRYGTRSKECGRTYYAVDYPLHGRGVEDGDERNGEHGGVDHPGF